MTLSRQYHAATKKMEDAFTPKVARIITQFRNAFISQYRQNPNEARNNLSKQTVDPKIMTILSQIYKVAGLTGAKMQWRMSERYVRAARRQEQKAGGFGRNEQWIRTVMEYLHFHQLKSLSRITETMREDILKALEKSIEEGWTLDETILYLRRANVIEARAKVITRTEINRASNVGHATAAKDLPFEVDKKWSADGGHRTRHSHNLVNNLVTEENGFFRVPIYKGDKPTGLFDEMLYPGDPEASAANTVNCRCRVIYTPKRDANGRLVMRDRNQATIIPMRSVTSYTDAQIAAQLKSSVFIGVKD